MLDLHENVYSNKQYNKKYFTYKGNHAGKTVRQIKTYKHKKNKQNN